jgi:DNA polymerase-4
MCSMRERDSASIIHADLDSFYASVEQRDHPHLRGKPVVVGGGVVLAASYEAKAYGISTPMGGRAARQACPHLIEVPPRFDAYVEASKAVFEIFRDTTPLVEGISIDEAFLDVSGLRRIAGSPREIAVELRRRVRTEVGLAISVGIAGTKFLAKVASAVGKPDGLLEVPIGTELDFLHPLPVERLWGVGPRTAEKLHARGITRVSEVAALPQEALIGMLGRGSGHHLHALANNQDPRPVVTGRRMRSMGSQQALGRGRRTAADLDAVLIGLVDRVARRLRASERVGRTVVLRIRFGDFTRISRSHTIAQSTDETVVLLEALRVLLHAELPRIADEGITLLGMAVSNLEDARAVQLALPFGGVDRRSLDAAVDQVRERFGSRSIGRTALVRRGLRAEAPRLPDREAS